MAELIKDGYCPTGSDDFKYIGLEHIEQQSLSLNSVGHSTEVESNKFRFRAGDILFGKLRPYFRKVYRPHFDGVCSTDIWVVRAKDGIDKGYLFYFMASHEFVDMASSGSSGTRMPRADWNHLKNIVWTIPPISEQRAIAKILSDLDAKIELNNQMNKTLAAMAQAIFKQWFVDFEFPNEKDKPYKSSGGKMVDSELGKIPKGWDIGHLEELIDITSGKRPEQTSDIQNTEFNVPLYGASSIMGFVKNTLYNEPIILIGRVGTHGIVQRIQLPSFPSDNTLVIKTKYYEYIYQILCTIDYSVLNVGSTQPLITQSGMKKNKTVLPSEKIIMKFENIVSQLYTKVNDNNYGNKCLSEIRDSLLPKLISGNIRICQERKGEQFMDSGQ